MHTSAPPRSNRRSPGDPPDLPASVALGFSNLWDLRSTAQSHDALFETRTLRLGLLEPRGAALSYIAGGAAPATPNRRLASYHRHTEFFPANDDLSRIVSLRQQQIAIGTTYIGCLRLAHCWDLPLHCSSPTIGLLALRGCEHKQAAVLSTSRDHHVHGLTASHLVIPSSLAYQEPDKLQSTLRCCQRWPRFKQPPDDHTECFPWRSRRASGASRVRFSDHCLPQLEPPTSNSFDREDGNSLKTQQALRRYHRSSAIKEPGTRCH